MPPRVGGRAVRPAPAGGGGGWGGVMMPLLLGLSAFYVTYHVCSALGDASRTPAVLHPGLADPVVAAAAAAAAEAAGVEQGGSEPRRLGPSDTKAGPSGIHVLCTSNGSPYLNWQTRIMYQTYKMVRDQPGSDLKHFTRLLHRRTDDELMPEVPTVRVDSLHEACDRWCEFPVADRPHALADWLKSEDSKRGEWIFMVETDYVWMRPLSRPQPEPGKKAISFLFHYIQPTYVKDNMNKLAGATIDANTIPRSGPAPTLIRRDDLAKMFPLYETITKAIEDDPEHKRRLGWVREMYAYSLAAAMLDIPHETQEPKKTLLIAQPPADDDLGNAALYHYTWGAQFKDSSGKVVWEFDKRPYTDVINVRKPQEHRPPMPPEDAVKQGLHLQDGKPVTDRLLAVEASMVGQMNKAIDSLRELPSSPGCGWLDNEPQCDFGCEAGELCVPEGAWH